jgi:methylmalonyl-CoA mutase N-terminal domain/subunit
MFAKMMRERFNVTNPQAMSVIIYDNSQASSFTAQQPLNNIIRGTITALVQALSGVQVMSIASFDEAHAIPSPEAVRIALRTQQIVAYETGVINTVDPLAGSYYVEALTDELEEKSTKLFEKVEELGGAVACIERGFQERRIAEEAYNQLKQIKSGDRVVVGVNKFQVDEKVPIQIMKVDPKEEERQIEKVKRLKKERNNKEVEITLKELYEAARGEVNLVLPILSAVKAYATIGEICDVLRSLYGEHKPSAY